MNRRVTFRYRMRNSSGRILANTIESEGASFVFGSGEIDPGLEDAFAGMKIGEQKSFSVSGDAVAGLQDTFHFDIVIDDIGWTEDLRQAGTRVPSAPAFCGPGCSCHSS